MEGPQNRREFTLIELVVVVAIIGILASMMLASLVMSQLKGRQAACINNIRQLTLAVEMYTSEWNGHFPFCTDGGGGAGQTGGWVYYDTFPTSQGDIADFDVRQGTLWKYVQAEGVYRCPADETNSQCSYGANGDTIDLANARSRKVAAVPQPSETPYYLEEGAVSETTNDGFFNIWWDDPATPGPDPDHVVNRHNEGSVYSYCDGHVTWDRLSDPEVYDRCNFLNQPPVW